MTKQAAALQLHFPRELSEDHVLRMLRSLSGASSIKGQPLRFSVRGTKGAITHEVASTGSLGATVARMRAVVPGLDLREVPTEEAADYGFLWRLWQSSSRRPLRTDRAELTSRAVLSSLARVRGSEAVELRWLLGPARRPLSVGSQHSPVTSESWPRALATSALREPGDLDSDARRALREKRAEAGWRLIGQIAVRASDEQRARALGAGVLAALRTAEGPGVRLGVRRRLLRHLDRTPWKWGLDLRAPELVGLLGFPIGGSGDGLPIARQRSRVLPATLPSPRQGRALGLASNGKALRIADMDSRRHLLILGPSGSGKSVLLQRLIASDIARGHGVFVLDPKGDLVEALLESSVPGQRRDDLVVIDPSDPAPVGLNPLHRPANPGLAADQMLGSFTALFDDLGPRSTDVLANALLTLARWGQGSLSVLPLLLTNQALRRRVLSETPPDPLGTSPFWSWYDSGISDAERRQIIAPGLNKIRRLSSPDLRAVFGQVEPRFSLRSMISGTPIVLVSLASGRLGPESSSLLSTVLIQQVWQTLQARSGLPEARRRQFGVYIDEVAQYLKVNTDLGDLLVLARSLAAPFTFAAQHRAQFRPELWAAVSANARSKIIFQLSSDDARTLAQGHPELDALDISGLPPFSAYASLLAGNQVQPYVSLRTEPPPEPSADPAELRAHSRSRYGRSRVETDAALEALAGPPQPTADEPLGKRPRRSS